MKGGKGGGPLEAFRADDFEPGKLGPAPGGEQAAKHMTHMIDIAEKVLPILTPEQRKIAADKIRQMHKE